MTFMKKNHSYLTVLALFTITVCFIAFKYKRDEQVRGIAFYPLKERVGIMSQSEEANLVRKQFANLMKVARTNPDDIKSRIELASLYICEARITGNYLYYDMAALKCVDEVLAIDSLYFDALALKALIQLSQHHFSDGLIIAQKAIAINPDNAFVHGVLVDANVELGNYPVAVEEADRMISIRPDLRSYSRVSYLREIYGDYPGAIEAMKMAVEAGPPGDEATEWTRTQLGKLFEMTNDLKSAEMHYRIALRYRPGYAYALAGLGRIALASKEYEKAISFYMQADSVVNDYSIKEDMADAFRLSGSANKADSIIKWLVNSMSSDVKKGENNGRIGHYADKELANVYLKAGDYDKALSHAIAEYNRRPGNIDVNETMAWVYYNKKDYDKASSFLGAAMKTASKNPGLLCHAGLIYAKTGYKEKAKELLGEVTNPNCHIFPPLKQEALNALQTL